MVAAQRIEGIVPLVAEDIMGPQDCHTEVIPQRPDTALTLCQRVSNASNCKAPRDSGLLQMTTKLEISQ